jgi:hypothetical protein
MSDSTNPEISADKLVTGYIEFAEALALGVPEDTPEMDSAGKAYFAVERLIRNEPAGVAWPLVREILRCVPDDRLDVYAAGPLEDLVRLRGAELVDAIEREAAEDERFRWALGCIWLTIGERPPEIMERIVRASGGKIRPLDASAVGRDRESAT